MGAKNHYSLKRLLLTGLIAAKKVSDAISDIYNSSIDVEHKKDKSPLNKGE